jgi:glutamine synthetase
MSSHNRFNAIDIALERPRVPVQTPNTLTSEFFGTNVFDHKAMSLFLSPILHEEVQNIMQTGKSLNRELAAQIADAMQKWALSKGATHYAHWFQPLTGRTAEKHDSFFTLNAKGKAIEQFSAEALVQQEPDGSSFPDGGLRATFEARGYTAWDPTSPAFILEVNEAKTLCIPTIFVTYGGQSLDYKLPLLKSQQFLEQYAVQVCQLFDKQVNRVFVTLGWEQEYFLLDEALFHARMDLALTGRTLVGRSATKGQQLEDHYFGAIPDRVYGFMRDLEIESHKLGIPVRTRHNEVAPTQYELAPIYEELNIAIDHNQLLMDLMDRIARRHKLRVLLHEKPYAGVNGSGKHNNWSLATDTGKNLLSPSRIPAKNLQFLCFFVNTIAAVFKYGDLLRASVASASNDHRLGANEAPPAIVSVFVGETLTRVLNELAQGEENTDDGVKKFLNLLDSLPNLELDNTDRNRTSPFAFTGNKFEVRMVGSAMNCSAPMTILNMIVGKQLKDFCAELNQLIEKGLEQDAAILSLIKKYYTASKNICFEGDGYSDEWKKEAATRGLNNFPDTPTALDSYISQSAQSLFEESGVLSEKELHAHHEVKLENYVLQLDIEARTIEEIAMTLIIPAALNYQNTLSTNVLQLQDIGFDKSIFKLQMAFIKDIGERIQHIHKCCNEMLQTRNQQLPIRERAQLYCDKLKKIIDNTREHIDHLESIVDDHEWPMPKYRELLIFR